MSNKKGAKIELLKSILDGKDILFGCFSKTLTKQIKNDKWKEIHEKAQALGIAGYDKDFCYTRDTIWQHIRKSTVKKLDNAKQTGAGGGPDSKLTEIDILVTDIIGKDSPVLSGLPVSETWGTNEEGNVAVEHEPLPQHEKTSGGSRHVTIHKKKLNKKEEEEELKLKKLKLSVEILEKESYERSLRILKLEKELSLAPSLYTKNLQLDENSGILLETGLLTENESEEENVQPYRL